MGYVAGAGDLGRHSIHTLLLHSGLFTSRATHGDAGVHGADIYRQKGRGQQKHKAAHGGHCALVVMYASTQPGIRARGREAGTGLDGGDIRTGRSAMIQGLGFRV